MIFTHELGHFMAARAMGVTVEEFAVGMGPKLLSKKSKKSETVYSLRLFPIGGFCQMKGEDASDATPGSFGSKGKAARLLILVAGAAMNLLTGFLILVIMFSTNDVSRTTVVDHFKDDMATPSQEAGLMVGDRIVKMGGVNILTADNISYYLNRYGEESTDVTVMRDGQKVVIPDVQFPYVSYDMAEVTGNEDDAGEEYREYYTDFMVTRVPNHFGLMLRDAFFKSIDVAKIIWDSLFDLVTGRVSVKQLSGPVGVTTAISTAAQNGLWSLANIVVLIAINLGVLNLLPLPALDGGRILFILIEAVIRRPVPANFEGYVHFAGLVIILAFSVFITFQDILRWF